MCVRAQRQQGGGCAEGRSWCWAQGQAAEPEPEGAEHIGKVNFLPVGASIPKVHKVQKEVASEGVLPIRFENVPPALFPVLPGGTDLPPSQTSFLKCPPHPRHCPQLGRPEQGAVRRTRHCSDGTSAV